MFIHWMQFPVSSWNCIQVGYCSKLASVVWNGCWQFRVVCSWLLCFTSMIMITGITTGAFVVCSYLNVLSHVCVEVESRLYIRLRVMIMSSALRTQLLELSYLIVKHLSLFYIVLGNFFCTVSFWCYGHCCWVPAIKASSYFTMLQKWIKGLA